MTRKLRLLVIAILSIQFCWAQDRVVAAKPQVSGLEARYDRSHAVIIGIDKYPKSAVPRDLHYAASDALAMKTILTKSFGFHNEDVRLLQNEAATLAGISSALASLSRTERVGVNDRVVIYFAGHGESVKLPTGGSQGFLVPSDATLPPRPSPADYNES